MTHRLHHDFVDEQADDDRWRWKRRSATSVTSGFHAKIDRSEEHTSELQSLMRISYAVFCLKKKMKLHKNYNQHVHAHPTSVHQHTKPYIYNIQHDYYTP